MDSVGFPTGFHSLCFIGRNAYPHSNVVFKSLFWFITQPFSQFLTNGFDFVIVRALTLGHAYIPCVVTGEQRDIHSATITSD